MAKLNLGKLAAKAKDFVDQNSDKIISSVDKVTDKIDQKTKGKYSDKLQKIDAVAHRLEKKPAADGQSDGESAAEAGQAAPPAAEAPDTGSTPPSFPEPS
ncbi:MAG TPA: antitoxin [Acidimicrobiales bacterium]